MFFLNINAFYVRKAYVLFCIFTYIFSLSFSFEKLSNNSDLASYCKIVLKTFDPSFCQWNSPISNLNYNNDEFNKWSKVQPNVMVYYVSSKEDKSWSTVAVMLAY